MSSFYPELPALISHILFRNKELLVLETPYRGEHYVSCTGSDYEEEWVS